MQTRKHVRIKSWDVAHTCRHGNTFQCDECMEEIQEGQTYVRGVHRTLLESGRRTVLEPHRCHENCDNNGWGGSYEA